MDQKQVLILALIFHSREMERYPHQIQNQGGKTYLTQMSPDMTDDDEHIYIRPKVKFDQTETETEDQVQPLWTMITLKSLTIS